MSRTTYFLLIGVQQYQSVALSKVAYVRDDIKGLREAYLGLGYSDATIVELLDTEATKTSIEYHLKHISGMAQKDDRIVIYFAGHGFTVNGRNLIAPVDARMDALEDTCIAIDHILGWLKKAENKRNLLFLDCCHSGFTPGEDIRNVTGEFDSSALALALRNEEYCVGFASCQTHQKSNSHPTLQHGVWSYFLIKALKGEGGDIYEDGLLTSTALQTYLRINTQEFVKNNTDDRRNQVPVQFGSATDMFIVEDLTQLFDAIETKKKSSSLNLSSIVIFNTTTGYIQNLRGFKPYHEVPIGYGDKYDNFVKSISRDLITKVLEELSITIKEGFNYTRQEMQVSIENGFGSIETPDFTYAVDVSQSSENRIEYTVTRSLDPIRNPDIINDETFNKVFEKYFTHLSFRFTKKLDIEDFIDRVEPLQKKSGFKVKYNPANISNCSIVFPDTDEEIVVSPFSIDITVPRSRSPKELIEVYKETMLLMESKKLKLLK